MPLLPPLNPRAKGLTLLTALILLGGLWITFIRISDNINGDSRIFVWITIISITYLLIMRAFDEAHQEKVAKQVQENSIILQTQANSNTSRIARQEGKIINVDKVTEDVIKAKAVEAVKERLE